MSAAQTALGALVLLPLLVAAACVLLPHTGRRVTGVAGAAGVSVLTAVVVAAVSSGEVVALAVGGHEAPLGVTLRADGLSALFLALSAVVGTVVTAYAALLPPPGHDADGRPAGSPDALPGFWPLWLGCWAGIAAVVTAGDLFTLYVGLELVSLTAIALVALGGPDAYAAALRYLFVAVFGSLLFLVGVALVVAVTGTLDVDLAARVLAEDPTGRPTAVVALGLMSVGLALKLALVPLHRWLIPAHAGAPSTVSPLLSALVIKASLVVLLRCWIWLVAPSASVGVSDGVGWPEAETALRALTWLLAGLGTLAILVGSVLALRQTRLKPLIAYSTVAQVGYWFLALPIVFDPASSSLEEQGVTSLADDAVVSGAVTGSVALALGHGLAKAALFLAAGYLKDVYGTDEIAELRGAGVRHPMLVMAVGLAAVGLTGLPLSLGFTGKWQLATAAVGAGHYWILVVLVAGTLLSAAYLLKVIAPLLVEAEDDDTNIEPPDARGVGAPPLVQAAPFALGVLTVASGFLGVWVSGLLDVGAPW